MSFPSGSQRPDPYQNFKVRLIIDGKCVYGGNCAHSNAPVPGLAASYAADARYRSGGNSLNPRKLPGRPQYPALTLERGVSLDQSFLNWAKQVSSWGSTGLGSQVPPANFRKDINLELYDEAGQLVVSYKILRSWVSSYSAPNLSADGNAVAIEHVHLENEGILMAAAHKSSR